MPPDFVQSGTKLWCAALIVLGGLSTGTAGAAANWVKVVDSKTSRIFVDTHSITRIGDIATAWYRRDFDQPMLSDKKHRPYKSSKVLNYFNCTSREMAPAQWITYEKTGGTGKIVTNEKVISLEYGDVSEDETGEKILNFVCKQIRQHN